MTKGFGIHGSTTDHGGVVISTQSRSSQMGNLFLRAGDGFACPKCKCWSTLIKSNDHVIFDGKAVAYVGDKFTCGATLLPKQMHVVGDSGGGAISPINFTNSLGNNNNSFVDEPTNSQIRLRSVMSDKFVPLGVASFDGKPSKSDLVFVFAITKGSFDKIVLEVEYNGDYIEVKKIEKALDEGMVGEFKWDGFVKDTYNSHFMTNPKGIKFRIRGYLSGIEKASHEKSFVFEYSDKNWMDVIINKRTQTIIINLRVNFVDGGASGLFNGHGVSPAAITANKVKPYNTQTKSFNDLLKLAQEGINYYWSRNNTHPTGKNIGINGVQYEVFVKTQNTKTMAMPEMKLTFITNNNPDDPLFRSSNWFLSRKTAYVTGYVKLGNNWRFYSYLYSDKKFKETIAHETGHAIVEAYAGFSESVTHHGSSHYSQNPKSGTTYPKTGEIDLMKYADETLSQVPGWDTRQVANSKDVTALICLSGIAKK